MGLYTTAFDATRLRGQIGPEVESADLLELERAMDAIPGEQLVAEIARSTEDWHWADGRPDDKLLERTFRLYLATIAICRERGSTRSPTSASRAWSRSWAYCTASPRRWWPRPATPTSKRTTSATSSPSSL